MKVKIIDFKIKTNFKVIGLMTKLMVMEHTHILMGLNTKAIGKKISKMAQAKKRGLITRAIKETIVKAENLGKENLDGLMVQNMKDIFMRIIYMEKV